MQPGEVVVAFAARAALRVLPMVWKAQGIAYGNDQFFNFTLAVFRATAIAWVRAIYHIHSREFAAAAAAASYAASAASKVASEGFAYGGRVVPRPAPAKAALAAAYAVDTPTIDSALAATDLAVDSAFEADAVDAFWSAVSIDTARVEKGATASDIAGSPLWPQGQPDHIQSLWHDLRETLLGLNQDWLVTIQQNWLVWTTWYDDRLDGRVRNEERELAYVRIEEALWNQGPAKVNAEIKRRIEEFDAEIKRRWIEEIPEQEPLATRFGVNSQGLIDVVPDPPAHGTEADALQREYYEEIRFKAQALVALGPNQLGDLTGRAIRFREGLKDRIEDVSITSLWSRGNTLRSRLKAHDLSLNNGEPDPARLPPLVAETLRDLVETWNIFIVGDPKGRELDEIRLGPNDVEAAKQVVAAGGPIVQAIQSSVGVATLEAIESVVEQAETAKTPSAGIDGDQAIDLSRKTTGNLVSEILRRTYSLCRSEAAFAWKEFRAGVYRAPGTAAFVGIAGATAVEWPRIVSFVAENAEALKAFVEAAWHNPTLVEIIDEIVRVWS